MTTTASKRAAALCALLATTAIASPALGQTARQYRNLDTNGVDLTHGDYVMAVKEGSIGSGDAELSLIRMGIGTANGLVHTGTGGHQWDNIWLSQSPKFGGGSVISVMKDARFEQFTGFGTLPSGSTLTDTYQYRTADGTVIQFADVGGHGMGTSTFCNGSSSYCIMLPVSITSPDGKSVSLQWDLWTDCETPQAPDEPFHCDFWARIASVSNSYGYRILFSYASQGGGGSGPPPNSWQQRTGATFHNDAAGGAAIASTSYSYPSTGVVDVTDTAGRTWRFTGNPTRIVGVRRPGAASDTTTIVYTGAQASSVTRDGVTTNYSRVVNGNIATMTVTDARPGNRVVTSNLTIGRPTSDKDRLNRTTSYAYDSSGRLTRVTAPEGNYVEYTLDARGNVTQMRRRDKSGTAANDIVTSATYPASCTNPKTCNQPLTTTDAGGNITEHEYDPAHGGLTKVTLPAPATGAARPQTRYGYTLTNGEYRLTSVSACATTAASGTATVCSGGLADEVKTTLAYDANGNVTSTSSGSGSGTLTATSAMTYDNKGDLLTVDGPLAGSADTVRYRYNAGRELVGVIGPDPDGAGALKHRAQRVTYGAWGQPTKVERGTVNSQTDTDWNGFASLEAVETAYDANARPVTSKLVAGASTYALTHVKHDALGRLDCAAIRMDPAQWASQTDACVPQTNGPHGPDRITRTHYDAAGQVTRVQVALGTADEADDATMSYRDNGQLETVIDGEGNRTTYEYDGHDRLKKTRFPSPTTDGVSSATDYEELSYDSRGNVTQRRLRDGQLIGYGYDNLSRLAAKDVPNSVAYEYDVSYGYDLLGRLTSATDGNGHYANLAYDALGRLASETSNFYGRSHQYDLAGRRTRLTHSDGFYVSYDWNLANEMTAIKESGTASLASFGYDDLGRRTSLTRGNGAVTSYGYDPVSRLASLAENPAGTAYDHTVTLAYIPASQIVTRAASNDAYAWSGHDNANVNDSVNGLNQLTATGSVGVSHDARGNISAIGAAAYGYTSENRLAGGVGHSFAYDPLGRMHAIIGSYTALQYDGRALVAEVSGGAVAKRYVHGPGIDEPLVEYTGSGTASKRWLHADERGSIVALSDASGNVTAVNKYDEYGSPQGSVTGRFGYTGQAWLPEVGLWYYKARMYNPDTSKAGGRFMQTDPIGYGDGMNLYDYVQGDPVSRIDPLGLSDIIVNGYPDSGSGGFGSARGFAGTIGLSTKRFLHETLIEESGDGSADEKCEGTDSDPAGCVIPVIGERIARLRLPWPRVPWILPPLRSWPREKVPSTTIPRERLDEDDREERYRRCDIEYEVNVNSCKFRWQGLDSDKLRACIQDAGEELAACQRGKVRDRPFDPELYR